MSRASVIVSNEPPDPKIDPKVQDILMEVFTEGPPLNIQITMNNFLVLMET